MDVDQGIASEFIRDNTGRIVGIYWTLTCARCRQSERIDMTKHRPVSDPICGSTLAGWEIAHRLIVCPDCCEEEAWSLPA